MDLVDVFAEGLNTALQVLHHRRVLLHLVNSQRAKRLGIYQAEA